MAFHKAERKKAKLRLGITGPAGSGKTYGALLLSLGLGGRVALIDTENGSGDLYSSLGDYDVCTLGAPYTVEKYLAAIEEAEKGGYDVLIIDSLSHAWAGEGGLLDRQGKIADTKGNSYTAWRTITPLHNRLVEALLTSPCHIVATMRSKVEYVQEKNAQGRTEIHKVGLAPVQRDGMDYEFTLVFELGMNHTASASKDRTGLFDGQVFTLTRDTGAALRGWLDSGADMSSPVVSRENHEPLLAERKRDLYNGFLEVCGRVPQHAENAMKLITEGRGSKEWTAEDMEALGAELERRRAACGE